LERVRGGGASKRHLESSMDWHASLLDQFKAACNDVRCHRRPVRLTGPVIVQHASAATPSSSQSTTSRYDHQGDVTTMYNFDILIIPYFSVIS